MDLNRLKAKKEKHRQIKYKISPFTLSSYEKNSEIKFRMILLPLREIHSPFMEAKRLLEEKQLDEYLRLAE